MGAKSKLIKKPGAAGVLKKSTVKKKPGAAAATLKGKPTSSTIAIQEETAKKDRIDKLFQKMVEWAGQTSEEDFVGRDKLQPERWLDNTGQNTGCGKEDKEGMGK